jgi:hypothetical protein|tara:strand:- start:10 stop:546 length:537 start_codon:yes stop_codon:yes gene_type:complete
MTYLKLKIDELVAECEKRLIDVEHYKENAKGKRVTKKMFVNLLIDDDMEKEGGLPSNRAPIKHLDEPVKPSEDDEFIKKHKVDKVTPEPVELNEADIQKIIDENETDDDLCKAIISIPTDKETKEAILPRSREELEHIISFNIEGNVNMICGKLHQRVKALETELAAKKKGIVIETGK